MTDDDGDDDDTPDDLSVLEDWASLKTATDAFGLGPTQVKALVQAGLLATFRNGGPVLYSVKDLQRLSRPEPPEQGLAGEVKVIASAYKELLASALKQTKQAQDHERQILTAFSAPLKTMMDGVQTQLATALTQNVQLLERANAGDKARLDFVQVAESIMKDRRAEDAAQNASDRALQLRTEVWESVKRAAPFLLEGLKTEKQDAAEKLKAKLDPAKVAALIHLGFLSEEETALLCTAFGYDRAELDALNSEASAQEAADAAEREAAQ